MSEERRRDYPDIMSRLGDLEIQIALLGTKFDNSHRTFREFQEETHELNKKITTTLYGNGQPGLTTKFDGLKDLPTKVDAIEVRMAYYAGGLAVLMLALKWLFKV